jgi:hypothetical protein
MISPGFCTVLSFSLFHKDDFKIQKFSGRSQKVSAAEGELLISLRRSASENLSFFSSSAKSKWEASQFYFMEKIRPIKSRSFEKII